MAGALVGALVTLVVVAILRLLTMRSLEARERALREDFQRMSEGLRAFAREAEEKLDRKLDRLEVLVKEAKGLLRDEQDPGADPLDGEGAEDSLNTPGASERERVLLLAAAGERPEAIAQAVGLLRAEVDLILRLHRTTEEMERE
jgi:hypothetical protein